MGKKKITARLLLLFICTGLLTGCAVKKEKQEETSAGAKDTMEEAIQVGALKGPTSMGMAQMLDDSKYEFTITASPDEIIPMVVKGEIDLAAIPANLSSVLYQKMDKQVNVLGINTLGVLYLIESGDTVHSAADLKGKTIFASGKGATPEYALTSVLKANGINPDTDVTVEYKSEHAEVMAALLSNPDAVGLLPQPFVTTALMKNESLRTALDLNELWEAGNQDGSRLVTGVVIVRSEFLKEHPEAVNAFMDEYMESVEFVNKDSEAAAKIIGDHDIIDEEIAVKAIPKCSILFVEGNEMRAMLSGYLNTLLEQNPETIGGNVPDEDFYYER